MSLPPGFFTEPERYPCYDPRRAAEEAERDAAEGSAPAVLFCAALKHFGTHLGTWTPLETLDDRVRDWCAEERERRALPVPGPLVDAAARRVGEYVVKCWLPYRSHILLGRPYHAWRRPDAVSVPVEQAVREVDAMKAKWRKAGRKGGKANAQDQEARREELCALYTAAVVPVVKDVAKRWNVSVRTVRYDLSSLRREGRI